MNLFIPSELTWRERSLTVKQEHAVPGRGHDAPDVHGAAADAPDAETALSRRGRVDGAIAQVNGQAVAVDARQARYVSIVAEWRTGDV